MIAQIHIILLECNVIFNVRISMIVLFLRPMQYTLLAYHMHSPVL